MWANNNKPKGILAMILLLNSVASTVLELEFLKEPTSVLVKQSDGRAAVFRCNVSPSSAHIRWLWQGKPVTQNRWMKVSRNKLTVHMGRMEKSSKSLPNFEKGFFQCEARLQNKILVSDPAKLIIAVLETFPMQNDVNVTAIKGNTAVIPCNPPYSVPNVVTEFIFNHSIIEKSSERQKLMTSGDLQILDVNTSDAGEYICVGNNPFLSEKRQAKHKVFLSVTEPIEPKAPSFITTPHPKTLAVLGSNISLECVATGYPVPIVTWRRHHGNLPRWRYQQVAGNLLLMSIRRGDEGIYYCEADNSVGGQISKSTEVQVQETPKITKSSRDITAELGQNVTLDCITRGHPKPIVTWVHNGKTLAQDHSNKAKDSQLLLRNVNQKHSGIFQCFASSELGTVSATAIVSVSSGNESLDADYENDDYEDYKPHAGYGSSTFFHRKEIHFASKGHHPSHNGNEAEKSVDPIIDGDSAPKRRKKKKTKGVKLIPPSRPEVTRLSDTSVMVRWGVPRNDGLPILFFKVQYREVRRKSTHWMTIDEDIAAHIHSYAVSDLRTGGNYRFRIAAVYSNNDNKLGPNSEKFILHKDPPTKKPAIGPKIVYAEAASPSAITLQWQYTDVGSIPIDGFFIYYRTTHSAGDYLKVTVLGANTRSHIISHLLPDTSYDIKMQCFNIAGTSEFSNIYTSKTKPSEAAGIRNRSSKPHHSEDVSGVSGTQPVSSKNSDGNMVLYIVLGVICVIMLIAMSLFIVLFVRQRQNRYQNRNIQNVRENSGKAPNGHISSNGFIPSCDKVNISINPLSQLEEDNSDKPDQMYDDETSNNNEIIIMQNFNGTAAQQEESLLENGRIDSAVDMSDEEENQEMKPASLSGHSGTKSEVPRSI